MRTYVSKTTGRKCYDPDEKNADRADWARAALEAFQAETGTDDCDAISDLLCDIRHLCDHDKRYGAWADALDRATIAGSHYDAETSKEG
jgi:hypothetical protein